ncbi:MAG: glycosyltransferase family 9 protein [Fimbriimonadaceae bacterium]|nr:glycosyltransferase family 9 protein [Fimbriimonadaceae bacterium]QYK55464.1 MAG: glycosyltransferase family 9 protein [Fimbriimonadaceae bacterium]
MRRFEGRGLGRSPRIAVVGNDALGNFVVLTPLFQALARQYGPPPHYFGGTRVAELAAASDLLAGFHPLFGVDPRGFVESLPAEPFDLVVNVESTPWAKAAAAILAGPEGLVCGPCLDAEGRGDLPFGDDPRSQLWQDSDWTAPDLVERYPFLDSGFIGGLFCRLAYCQGEVPGYALPSSEPPVPTPPILVATAASLPEKLWPVEKWVALVEKLLALGEVGLLGAPPKAQSKYWVGASDEDRLVEAGARDLRGRFSLPEVVGALARARLVVSLDNGVLHLVCATRTPVIGLFREGVHRLWAPPVENLTVLTPPAGRPASEISLDQIDERLNFLKEHGPF